MTDKRKTDETQQLLPVVDQDGMGIEVVETVVDMRVDVWVSRSPAVRAALEAVMAGFRSEAVHIVSTGTHNEAAVDAGHLIDPDAACSVPQHVWAAYDRAVVRHTKRAFV